MRNSRDNRPEVVDDGRGPSYYVTTPSRGRRMLHWFFASGAYHWVAASFIGLSILIWRWQAGIFLVGLTIGWYIGWLTAKAAIKQNGELPPL